MKIPLEREKGNRVRQASFYRGGLNCSDSRTGETLRGQKHPMFRFILR